MLVLLCLILSVLSTVDSYTTTAAETLFYMVAALLLLQLKIIRFSSGDILGYLLRRRVRRSFVGGRLPLQVSRPDGTATVRSEADLVDR